MKKILILGSGAGGTMVANNLRRKLSPKQWEVTIIDNDEIHHYQQIGRASCRERV